MSVISFTVLFPIDKVTVFIFLCRSTTGNLEYNKRKYIKKHISASLSEPDISMVNNSVVIIV